MNERELDHLLSQARRLADAPRLPMDFACEVQARLPKRSLLDGLQGLLAVLVLLTPLTAMAGVFAVAGRSERAPSPPPALALYQGGGLDWKASR